MKELVQDNPSLSDLDQEYKKIVYDYDLVSGKVNEVQYQPGEIDQFYHQYEYDADNRITNVFTSSDGTIWDQDAKYFYYRHGPLMRTELTNDKAQGLDYAYTLHGWMKVVNSNSLKETHDIGQDGNTAGNLNTYVGRDEYGYSLSYYGGSNGDYTPIAAGSALGTITSSGLDAEGLSLYNGNIRHMITSIRQFMSGGTSSPQAMAYRYDQLNRITKADMFNNMDMSTTYAWGANGIQTDYQERYRYDLNGNILNLSRKGVGNTMDGFTYNYTANTNQLTHVDDDVTLSGNYADDIDDQASGNYDYDEIGNLVKDASEYIDPSYTGSGIEWNVYGKISSVTRTTQNHNKSDLEFKYDAMGNRIMKLAKPRNAGALSNQENWTYTYYVRDAQGNVMATYQRTFSTDGATEYTDKMKQDEGYVYGSNRVAVRNDGTEIKTRTYTFTGYNADGTFIAGSTIYNPSPATPSTIATRMLGKKQYELANHLGNILVTITDQKVPTDIGSNGTINYFSAKMTTASDYTPFGAMMASRSYRPTEYRYGFNGKEKDDEVKGSGNSYDFGARVYDSRVGKWLIMDPLSMKYPNLSPYNFVANSPIMAFDPDGKKILIHYQDAEGNDQTIEYQPGLGYLGDDAYVKAAFNSLDEAVSYGGGKTIMKLVNSDKVVNIMDQELKKNGRIIFPAFDLPQAAKNGVLNVYWNPAGGAEGKNAKGGLTGKVFSPGRFLFHELVHVKHFITFKRLQYLRQDIKLKKFSNLEEKKTIKEENKVYADDDPSGERESHKAIGKEIQTPTADPNRADPNDVNREPNYRPLNEEEKQKRSSSS